MGLGVGEDGCRLTVDDLLAVHRDRPTDLHRVDREVVPVAQRNVDDLVRITVAVEEPVVVLELIQAAAMVVMMPAGLKESRPSASG